jgi:hypothetical protein
MGYIEELWRITKSGKHRGIPRFFRKIRVDDGRLSPQVNSILHLRNTTGKETRYLVERIEHEIRLVPKSEYDDTGTEYYARIIVKRY